MPPSVIIGLDLDDRLASVEKQLHSDQWPSLFSTRPSPTSTRIGDDEVGSSVFDIELSLPLMQIAMSAVGSLIVRRRYWNIPLVGSSRC